MSERYQACLHIDRLQLPVTLGYGSGEREKKQAIELDLRFFFRARLGSCDSQALPFLCYDKLSHTLLGFVEGKEFQLIEFLSSELLRVIREHIARELPEMAPEDIRILLTLHKCHPPVPAIQNGVRFIVSDLPEGFKVGDVL